MLSSSHIAGSQLGSRERPRCEGQRAAVLTGGRAHHATASMHRVATVAHVRTPINNTPQQQQPFKTLTLSLSPACSPLARSVAVSIERDRIAGQRLAN